LLDIAHAEAAPMFFGFDRLAAWNETWGWDSTDLDWEARVYGEFVVLRFGRHWPDQPFPEALEGFGYGGATSESGTTYAPDPTAEIPWQLRFANMHGLDVHGRGVTEPMVWVAISHDGHTAVLGRDDGVGQILHDGLEVAASVSPLHRYEALAAGYTRAGTAAAAEGRYVLAYPEAWQAQDDLPGRRTLVEQGLPMNDLVSRYQDVGFGLVGAHVAGTGLVLDVAPVGGSPEHIFRHLQMTPIFFAICGSVPEAVD
jgi:hypothetical protein